jgi:hypothetical protein
MMVEGCTLPKIAEELKIGSKIKTIALWIKVIIISFFQLLFLG